jgi:hypothetical protein
MTESRAPKRGRWSRGRVRALAWLAGAATFATGFGILGLAPRPAVAGADRASAPRTPVVRQKVIVRRITRRVVIVDPPSQAPVTYVSSGSSGGSTTSSSSSGGGYTAPAPAPAPAPVSTGGSGAP